jgi:5-formyltetrahydrofolate cyclo-ligase
MADRTDESSIARTPAADEARTRLREALIAARRPLSDPRRRAANDALLERLDALLGDVGGVSIAIYWPIRGEPSLGSLPQCWAQRGARTALPVVDAPRTPLRFLAWRPGEPTVPGFWRIPRPTSDVALRPDVLVVPCVGFTAEGHRLGYGGGFYDRSLAALDADGAAVPRAIGVAWDEALLEGFDPLPTDRPLEAVVTPSATYLRAARSPRTP